jgi:hypothetical protein
VEAQLALLRPGAQLLRLAATPFTLSQALVVLPCYLVRGLLSTLLLAVAAGVAEGALEITALAVAAAADIYPVQQ